MDLSDQKTQLMLLGVLGSVGLIYVWFTYLYSPKNETIGELSGQVTELTGEVQQLEAKVGRLAATESQLQALQAQWEETLRSFPTEPKEEEVFGNLSHSEVTSGVYITSITKGDRRVRELYIEEDYSLVLMGRYSQMGEFIKELASMPRRIMVNYMQLLHPSLGGRAAGGDGGAGPPPQEDEVVIRCTITTFQVREGG